LYQTEEQKMNLNEGGLKWLYKCLSAQEIYDITFNNDLLDIEAKVRLGV